MTIYTVYFTLSFRDFYSAENLDILPIPIHNGLLIVEKDGHKTYLLSYF